MTTYRSNRRTNGKQHERDIQKDVLSRLNLFGGKWYGVKKTNDDGCPDIIGWYNNKSFSIELKTKDGDPSKLQLDAIADIKLHGGPNTVVGICRSIKEVFDLIKASGERSP